jgi:hypothetical protein
MGWIGELSLDDMGILRVSDAFFDVGVCVLRDWLEHGTTTSMTEGFYRVRLRPFHFR